MTSSEHPQSVTDSLRRLVQAAEIVWAEYQKVGPSKVGAKLYDAVATAADEIEQSSHQFGNKTTENVKQLRDLCYRCACTPMGLCFVTGEAGLIPRKDQHEAFECALKELSDWADESKTSF